MKWGGISILGWTLIGSVTGPFNSTYTCGNICDSVSISVGERVLYKEVLDRTVDELRARADKLDSPENKEAVLLAIDLFSEELNPTALNGDFIEALSSPNLEVFNKLKANLSEALFPEKPLKPDETVYKIADLMERRQREILQQFYQNRKAPTPKSTESRDIVEKLELEILLDENRGRDIATPIFVKDHPYGLIIWDAQGRYKFTKHFDSLADHVKQRGALRNLEQRMLSGAGKRLGGLTSGKVAEHIRTDDGVRGYGVVRTIILEGKEVQVLILSSVVTKGSRREEDEAQKAAEDEIPHIDKAIKEHI